MKHSAIDPEYLDRTAFVYLRQSSHGQVRKNQEGQHRQRRMVEQVQRLGWPPARIVLLDADTGRTGSSQHGREDLQRLFEAVATGRAGLVAACELSRLIRDNQDWAHLVRLCRFKNVLLADENRVYDAREPQDRMVLGIQGAFNEFELSMIIDRMQKCLREKARRGEQYDAFSPGYICRQGHLLEKHPDERVQRSVEKIFRDFEQCTSVRQLYLKLWKEKFQLFVVPHGRDWRDVVPKMPRYYQILEMLRHPVYAGIYVRGRCKAFADLDEHGHKRTRYRRVPREAWDVFIADHHEAYISRETLERNVKKIEANANTRSQASKGAPGNGPSVLAGVLRCRRCGCRLRPQYSSQGVRYVCFGVRKQREQGGAKCFSFSARTFETHIIDEILEVVGPAGLAATECATVQLREQYATQRQLVVDRLAAAREAEQRAEREYKRTDVTYVSVRQKLAQEWEAALARVQQEQACLRSFDETQPLWPTSVQREQLAQLGENVRRVWEHPRATMSLKQQLVRVLIEEIIVDIDETRDEVVFLIHWSGGCHTEWREPRKTRSARLPRQELRDAVLTLRKVLDDASMASLLNREGIRTLSLKTWTASRIQQYRQREAIPEFSDQEKASSGWMTQAETATCLQISPMSVHRLVRAGILPAEQPHRGLPMVISRASLEEELVQRAVQAVKSGHPRPLPDDPRQRKLF